MLRGCHSQPYDGNDLVSPTRSLQIGPSPTDTQTAGVALLHDDGDGRKGAELLLSLSLSLGLCNQDSLLCDARQRLIISDCPRLLSPLFKLANFSYD